MQLKQTLRKIISNAKSQMTNLTSLHIINTHMACPLNPISKQPTKCTKIQLPIKNRTQLIPQEKILFFEYLFNEKFKNSNIKNKFNESFEEFAHRAYNKNKTEGCIDLSEFYIEISDFRKLDERLGSCSRVNLSSNLLDFEKLPNLFHTNLCSLSLNNCGLNNKTLNHLFKCLATTPITSLDLSSKTLEKKNRLTDPSELYKLIESSQSLAILGLADIGLDENNCADIFEYLRDSNVVSIDLSRSDGVVGSGKEIEILVLRNNKIKSLKGMSFKECRFELIDLSSNKLQVRNMEPLFKPQLLNIKDLILDENPLGSLDLLQKFLIQKAHLKLLSLKKCNLTVDAIKSLFNGVEMNNNIETLNISQNFISKEAGKIIAESVRKLKLKSLNMSQCEVLDESGEEIAKQLIYNRKLKSLNLSQNKLFHLTGSALTLTLRTNRCLTTLNISQNIIPYKYIKQIKEWIDFNNYTKMDKKETLVPVLSIQTEENLLNQSTELLNLQSLEQTRAELQKDIKRLSNQNTRLINSKQVYEELEQVFNFLDNQGSEAINKLMDELEEIQGRINEQKEMKIEIARKSLTHSST